MEHPIERITTFFLFFIVGVCASAPVLADSFGSGVNAFDIEFVTIGDPGNVADTTGDPDPAGAVPYIYRIGKFEISEGMIDKANAITDDEGNPLGITHDGRGPNKPATRVSWFEAAQFVNWLNTSSGSVPAYNFDANGDFQLWTPADPGYNSANKFRNTQATYFLPSADEWYKAAFYDPVTDTWFDFPNGSNTAPLPVASGTDPNTAVYDQSFAQGPADILLAGGRSPFGTVAQAGNVWEWEETAVDLVNDDPEENRGFRGGGWLASPTSVSSSFRHFIRPPGASGGERGFRVASIPEPSTVWLVFTGASVLFFRRRSPKTDMFPNNG